MNGTGTQETASQAPIIGFKEPNISIAEEPSDEKMFDESVFRFSHFNRLRKFRRNNPVVLTSEKIRKQSRSFNAKNSKNHKYPRDITVW